MNRIVDTFVAPVCLEHIELLQQDPTLLIINKPSGLLSLSGKNPLNKDSVHFRLIKDYPTATLVHRLDLGTSGVMLIALDKPTNAHLTKQFQQRTVVKHYKAVLQGHLLRDEGIIDLPIAKDNSIFPRLKICLATGKPARTHYTLIEHLYSPDRSVVSFTPETGRTHQLRIHSEAIGHPILGCDLYGNKQSHAAATRLMLHAEAIEFVHPVSGLPIQAKCECIF